MSLKTFHVVFIAVSLFLTIGFGVWAVKAYSSTGDAMTLAMGVGSFVSTILLSVYGVWFLKKLRGISFE